MLFYLLCFEKGTIKKTLGGRLFRLTGGGTGKLTFNDKETHEVKVGDIIIFNGDNYIQGDFTQPSLLSVVLVPLK